MRIGTPGLTILPGQELQAQTESGMAHLAGTGPANTTCRTCKFWTHSDKSLWRPCFKRDLEGGLRPRQCNKFTKLVGRHGDAVSHDTVSCKYYEGAKRYPKIEKRVRKVK